MADPSPPPYDAMVSAASAPILVVDDDVKIVSLVRTYLQREGYRVTTALEGRSALASIALEPPALVVLDLMLPEVDGIAILRAIRRNGRTPVVVLSARGTPRDRIEGLEEGADDYVVKPFSPAELVLRIRRLLQPPLQPPAETHEPIHHGPLAVDRDRHEVTIDGRPIVLTRIELELLWALLSAQGRVLSREQLLDAVHGIGEADVLDRTIDVHIKRLRQKLGDDALHPRFVATIRGVGYRALPAS